MKTGYYKHFRRAEKLGEQFIRDLFNCILLDIEQERDEGDVNFLVKDIETLRTFPGSKKLAKVYQELSDELCNWLSKNCEYNELAQLYMLKA